ncbi:MAG TPA: NAD(P)-dependent oxidoreductase [Candidatus Saccharibacteria bacterium]|jgi:D-lactate dehydrogenase|nr:NAD(P)-dependent oxidoreductase [Candidatus Saccharibacteria bacterium]HMR38000.1 NAD(P)-dependent oxidoreductase [Candidatus Saccharibacteria bacterium]
MAKISFYDTTEVDQQQLVAALASTDHAWEFREGPVAIDNIDPEAEILSVFVGDQITREVMQAMPNLKLIACRSTGYDNIDLHAARDHGVTVVNVPSYGDETVAEYSITLILLLSRSIPQTLNVVAHDKLDPAETTGFDLQGKTVGILGTGRIGQRMARLCHAFGMKVVAFDPHPNEDLIRDIDAHYCSLDELAAMSDVISLHMPYLPSTHHTVNKDFITKLKPGAIIINTGRGELIDTEALLDGLLSGKVGGAGLDVIENESLMQLETQIQVYEEEYQEKLAFLGKLHVLRSLPNVIITPHNAYNTVEARGRINQTTADNIINFWYGNIPNEVTIKE